MSTTRTPTELRAIAAQLREAAQYADSREAYRKDINQAADLEHQAKLLEQQQPPTDQQ